MLLYFFYVKRYETGTFALYVCPEIFAGRSLNKMSRLFDSTLKYSDTEIS